MCVCVGCVCVCQVENVDMVYCSIIRGGGPLTGSHGDGGLIRKIPDSGGVRCCLVGLCVWYCLVTITIFGSPPH